MKRPEPATLDRLRALFESAAMDANYGEAISIRSHMLQCAELAQSQGLGPVLVAAALLHDIGWTMPGRHEAAAADWLEPLFGPAVTGPIRLHVEAKRFLVASDSDYFRHLSDESRRTLEIQGGPMSAREMVAFATLPGHAAAVALRRLDDLAKAPQGGGSRFADYQPMLVRLAAAAHDPRTP